MAAPVGAATFMGLGRLIDVDLAGQRCIPTRTGDHRRIVRKPDESEAGEAPGSVSPRDQARFEDEFARERGAALLGDGAVQLADDRFTDGSVLVGDEAVAHAFRRDGSPLGQKPGSRAGR